MNRFPFVVSALCLGLTLAGCSGLKKASPAAPATKPLTYEQDIRPLLQSKCVQCHTGKEAQAGYDLSTYIGVLGGGRDLTPNAVPGDARSLLVAVTQPGGSQFVYVGSDDNAALIRTWVVKDSMALAQPTVHPTGWTDVNAQNFHGKALKASGFDFTVCQACHGPDYGGGIARRACTACHLGGPEACAFVITCATPSSKVGRLVW